MGDSTVAMKIVMLGEGRVGKTSLLHRFVRNSFDEECSSTTKASMYANVKVNTLDGVTAELSIWDTAGQERYHALGPIYYRGAQGAILTYDITEYESFLKVKVWLKELQQVVGKQNVSIVVVGNKVDLERQRRVPLEEAEEWARHQNAQHYNVSAKLGLCVAEPFNGIVMSVRNRIGTLEKETSQTLMPTTNGVTSKLPIGFGAAPPRSRATKIKLNETQDGDTSALDHRCRC